VRGSGLAGVSGEKEHRGHVHDREYSLETKGGHGAFMDTHEGPEHKLGWRRTRALRAENYFPDIKSRPEKNPNYVFGKGGLGGGTSKSVLCDVRAGARGLIVIGK